MRGVVLPGSGKQKPEEEKQPTPEGEKRYEMGRFGMMWETAGGALVDMWDDFWPGIGYFGSSRILCLMCL